MRPMRSIGHTLFFQGEGCELREPTRPSRSLPAGGHHFTGWFHSQEIACKVVLLDSSHCHNPGRVLLCVSWVPSDIVEYLRLEIAYVQP